MLRFCQGVPILLIGLKKELRYDMCTIEHLAQTLQRPVTVEQGEAMRKRIGAYKYLECSAKTNEGVPAVFEHAARAAIIPKVCAAKSKSKRRSIRSLFRSSS